MGKAAKGSRKGKKAWRANISTADIEDYLEKATREAALPSVPDEALFFYEDSEAQSKTKRKKTEVQREKPLRHEALLQKKNPPLLGAAVPSSSASRSKKRKPIPMPATTNPEAASDPDLCDIWEMEDHHRGLPNRKRSIPTPAPIPAVEIEPLGCSFNPPFEAHQDALAKAVADEMQKLYHKELQPEPVPLIVAAQLPISEEDRFFLDTQDAAEDADDDADDSNEHQLPRKPKAKKLTRVELNRRARRKELLRAQAEANRIQTISKEIDR